jgi:hypothetical protein
MGRRKLKFTHFCTIYKHTKAIDSFHTADSSFIPKLPSFKYKRNNKCSQSLAISSGNRAEKKKILP